MNKKISFLVTSLLFILLIPRVSQATAGYIGRIINKETKECSYFFAGDECQKCEIPKGWELYPNSDKCPKGYKETELDVECHIRDWKAFTKNQCAGFISGRYGIYYQILSIILIGLIILGLVSLIIFIKNKYKNNVK